MSEFRKGAPLLAGAFLGIGTGVSSLLFYSQGLFLKPLAEAFGWTRGEASLGPLVGTLCAAVAAGPTGRFMDRIGPARTAVLAMLMLSAGFAALGLLTTGLGVFLIITGLVALVTVGSSPLSYTRILIEGFDRHRGLALGLALTGTGFGAFLLPVLLAPLIAEHGWRSGYLALTVVVALAVVPVGLLLRQPRAQTQVARPVLPPLSDVLMHRAFAPLGLTFLLGAMGALGTVVHFPAMLSDAGLEPKRIGAVVGSIGVAVIGGRALAGLLLDRVPARFVTSGFFALSAVGLLMLGLGGVDYALYGALALGLSVGAEVDLIAYLVSRIFAKSVYGTAYGGIYTLFLVGGALGPAIMGYIFDLSGSYRAPLLFASGCLTCAALLSTRLSAPRREPDLVETGTLHRPENAVP